LIIGVLAITSTGSFAPQAWKIIKTRETKDISTGSLTVVGFALWLAYGVMLGQWPLIATNGICLLLQTQTDGSSDATASLGLAVSLCAVCRPIAVDGGFT
jgi:hypothetical protein